MKFLAIAFCSVVVAAAAVPAAAADAVDRGFRPFIQGQEQDRAQGQGMRLQRGGERPSMPRRDMGGMAEGDRARMSPDERRQLRRDIQDAGKDIYLPARQAPADRRRSERR